MNLRRAHQRAKRILWWGQACDSLKTRASPPRIQVNPCGWFIYSPGLGRGNAAGKRSVKRTRIRNAIGKSPRLKPGLCADHHQSSGFFHVARRSSSDTSSSCPALGLRTVRRSCFANVPTWPKGTFMSRSVRITPSTLPAATSMR